MKIPLFERFRNAHWHKSTVSGLTIPIEVVEAADALLDVFSMYKILVADTFNRTYWPERQTLHPSQNRAINHATTVLTLYHARLTEFSDYKLCCERKDDPQSVKNFRNKTDKFEITISQIADHLVYSVEYRID